MAAPSKRAKHSHRPTPAIAGQLELRRQRLGMSRTALAKRSGISFPQVRRILDGKEQPRLDTLQAIVAALGMEATLVEKLDADDFRMQRAHQKAVKLAGMVQGSMGLEYQAVDQAAMKSLVQQHVASLLAGSGRSLWDD
jgi:transcriptional regulator with XRE-family HTH domain